MKTVQVHLMIWTTLLNSRLSANDADIKNAILVSSCAVKNNKVCHEYKSGFRSLPAKYEQYSQEIVQT